MKFYLPVCILFFGLLSSSFGYIDFHQCDAHDMEIERIYMEACRGTPCHVSRGRTYTISVHPDDLHTWVDDINVSARAVIRGAAFPVNAYVVSQGLKPMNGQQPLKINVLVNSDLLRGPAPLIINATYLHKGIPTCRFCVEFDVDIF